MLKIPTEYSLELEKDHIENGLKSFCSIHPWLVVFDKKLKTYKRYILINESRASFARTIIHSITATTTSFFPANSTECVLTDE